MPRCGSGSVPIAIGWKCTNCRRTHRSSIPRSAFGNTRARPELTTGTSQPPRNWSAPCHGSSERCNSILNRSDPICFLFADRDVPLLMRGCIEDIRVMKYQRLKNLVILVTAVAYFAATFLGQQMKLRILCEKLMIISQRFFGIPPFRFYALADGIRRILSQGTFSPPEMPPPAYRWS